MLKQLEDERPLFDIQYAFLVDGAKIGVGREGFPLLKEGDAGLHVFCDGKSVALDGEDERLICFHVY